MFSPASHALDLRSKQHLGQLVPSPLQLGTWAVLEQAGPQNHSPQLFWLTPNQRADSRWLLTVYRSLEAGGAFGHDYSELLPLNSHGSLTEEIIPIAQMGGRVHGSQVVSADGKQLLQFFRSRQAEWP